ncbi:MAG TPA: hypothetical protein VK572_12570 [Burkholderiales bacterium]|nr:hypothetical protein [Burkholderiales bacterium]
MPNPCRIDAELQASEPYVNGLPTRYAAIGHASRNCTRVHVIVRATPNGPAIFDAFADTIYQQLVPGTADLDPQNDGSWRVDFAPPIVGLPCGLELWVDATCVSGTGGCGFHDWSKLGCKNHPDRPGPGEDSQPGSDDGTDHGPGGGTGHGPDDGRPMPPWVWDPPSIACPRFGGSFLRLLLLGLTLVAGGVCIGSAAIVFVGVGTLAAAGLMYSIWQYWCAPNYCYFWGGVLWVFKRATLAATVFALASLSLSGWLLMIGYGIVGGWVMLRLQRHHCEVPSGRTPMNQLPLF